MPPESEDRFSTRGHPAEGVHEYPWQTTIAFVTVCTKGRKPWLANRTVHAALRATWLGCHAWKVGRYVVMPDHVHFFAAPDDSETEIEAWIGYWKRVLSRALESDGGRWLPRAWHMRMRSAAHCQQQWDYMLDNPVASGVGGQDGGLALCRRGLRTILARRA